MSRWIHCYAGHRMKLITKRDMIGGTYKVWECRNPTCKRTRYWAAIGDVVHGS